MSPLSLERRSTIIPDFSLPNVSSTIASIIWDYYKRGRQNI
jgi:hypothetical protein